jgi:antitoxin (DNA-binding transcriptional repressor) of toxin-antitoxin stability system
VFQCYGISPGKALPNNVKQNMLHSIMKTASVRDLRLHFPRVEGWLAEGDAVVITKSGKRIAMLTRAGPTSEKSPRSAFAKRFGTPLPRQGKTTHIAQTLMEDRGL